MPASLTLMESGFSPRRQPFLYLSAALLAGILADRWATIPRPAALSVLSLSICGAVILIWGKKGAAATLALLAGFMAAGALLSQAEREGIDESRLTRLFDAGAITPDDPVELTGLLVAPPEPAPDAFFLDVEAEAVRASGKTIAATGRARLVLSLIDGAAANEFNRLALDYGSRVRVLVRLERARAYHNPGSPDFNEFLELRGYDLRGAIKSPLLIEPIGRVPVSGLLAPLYCLRLRLLRALDASFTPRAAGTLKAMLANNRYYLDAEAAERLQEGGTFHVLSISGMHVAIIAGALLFVGRNRRGRRRAIYLCFVLAALWAYAVMVGLAPPVTRATVMITVGLIGPLLFRRVASVNTVALAAFLMLAAQPSLVADPGFQLSFVAVAGIVALALPVTERLRAIGGWRPAPWTPHPPVCSQSVRRLAELLYWDERRFAKEMLSAPVRYGLDKSGAARVASRLRVQPALRYVALFIIISVAVQLTTLPLSAFYFNRVSPVGILLNIVAGMLTAIVMLGGVVTPLVYLLSGWAGSFSAWVVTLAHDGLIYSVNPFLNIPGMTFRVAHYEGWQAIIYALYFVPLALLAAWIDQWRPVDGISRQEAEGSKQNVEQHKLLTAYCLLPAVTAAVVAVIWPIGAQAVGRLSVHFLDVGQGDAALIVFPQGATMLVDGGGSFPSYKRNIAAGEEGQETFSDGGFRVGEVVVSRYLWSRRLTGIDYVLATHADADHTGGLSDVVRNFAVGEAIVGSLPTDDGQFEGLLRAAARRGVPIGLAGAGMKFNLEGVTVEVLWPPLAANGSITSGNNDSVVLRLTYGSVAVLLTGDIEQAAEEAMVSAGMNLRADVMKAPHHGSRSSSSEAFLDAVRPRWAVVSAGERNRFGHPHQEVVERCRARGVELLLTGRDGMITVETNGATVDVSAYRRNGR